MAVVPEEITHDVHDRGLTVTAVAVENRHYFFVRLPEDRVAEKPLHVVDHLGVVEERFAHRLFPRRALRLRIVRRTRPEADEHRRFGLAERPRLKVDRAVADAEVPSIAVEVRREAVNDLVLAGFRENHPGLVAALHRTVEFVPLREFRVLFPRLTSRVDVKAE